MRMINRESDCPVLSVLAYLQETKHKEVCFNVNVQNLLALAAVTTDFVKFSVSNSLLLCYKLLTHTLVYGSK